MVLILDIGAAQIEPLVVTYRGRRRVESSMVQDASPGTRKRSDGTLTGQLSLREFVEELLRDVATEHLHLVSVRVQLNLTPESRVPQSLLQ